MWWLKIAAKIVLSRLPVSYGVFRRMGLFRHGAMDTAGYAVDVVFDHLQRICGPEGLADKTCLELGPGDSLASAVITHALGAKRTYLVDAGAFAEPRIGTYQEVSRELIRRGYDTLDFDGLTTTEEMLTRSAATYLTDGLASLKTIRTGSVDIIWSQAVLEHIRLNEVTDVLLELRRILSPRGIMSHRIDYKDHLGGSLNNLRFPETLWESDIMANSGFYTNRIRNSEFLQLLEEADFELMDVQVGQWQTLPLPRSRMAAGFRALDENDLLTKHVNIVAVPKLSR